MEFSGKQHIPVSPHLVWEAMNDPIVLQRAIPKCEHAEKLDDNQFKIYLKVKIALVPLAFHALIDVEAKAPPTLYKVYAAGGGSLSGMASGISDVELIEISPNQTELRYCATASLEGWLDKIADFTIKGIVERHSDHFFAKFSELVVEYAKNKGQ